MTLLWSIRFSILVVLQIITSTFFISKCKKRISYFTEVFLTVLSIAYTYKGIPYLLENYDIKYLEKIYANHSFSVDKLIWYIIFYIIMKIMLVIIIWCIRYFSFYALVSITKNGLMARICYKIWGKVKFSRFVSTMWNKVNYGLNIKKGIPGMVNKKHKVTGVRFDKDGFPQFDSIFEIKLPRNLYRKSRETHFRYANKKIYERIKKDKRFARKFTKSEIESFKRGETPSKFTWHHHQDSGRLQLVYNNIHAKVNHRGGYSIWGNKN